MNKFEVYEPLLGGWAKYLKDFIESEHFFKLTEEMKEMKEKGVVFTPNGYNIFKFLQKCPPSGIKLIIIGMDSYPGKYPNGNFHATGVAFDCSNSPNGKLQPSLQSFWEGIEEDLGVTLEHSHKLDFLCEQGVLLGNRALNCKLYKTGSMIPKWDIFWDFFLTQVISKYFNGVPIVFLGKEAKVLKKYVFEMINPVFEITHPSAAARNNILWDTKKTFSKVNRILKDNNGEDGIIIWNKTAYEQRK